MVPVETAFILLLISLPFCLAAILTDLRHLRIPNVVSIGMFLAFAVVGPMLMPLDAYLWRMAAAGGMLVIGFVLFALNMMGAGDSKFMAASAPYFAPLDWSFYPILIALTGIAGLIAHRVVKHSGLGPKFAPQWKSWRTKNHFPYGLALASGHIFYLLISALLG